MSIEEAIKAAMAKMIERKYNLTNVVVSSWEEEFDVHSYGGCETCGPEYEKEFRVSIRYSADFSRGIESSWYEYEGKFTDLIKELDA